MGFSFMLSQYFSQLEMAIFGGEIEVSNLTFRIAYVGVVVQCGT